jgi:hypothetical protein
LPVIRPVLGRLHCSGKPETLPIVSQDVVRPIPGRLHCGIAGGVV